MWNILRREPLAGCHFRRQVRLGRYYVDFASHAVKLVIEIDGGSHFTDAAGRHDAFRDAFLVTEGYRVLRFTTSEVLGNLRGVVEAILAHLPPPVPASPVHPPHQGEGWAGGAEREGDGEAR